MRQFNVLTTMAMTGLLTAAIGATAAAVPCPPDQPQCRTDRVRDGAAGVAGTPVVQRESRHAIERDGEGLGGEEKRELLRMQQEEKMARDVYLAMSDHTGSRIFENIKGAEQRHLSAITGLIDMYGLQDPIVDDTPGVFVDPVFGKLYEELVDDGSGSLSDALMVGARIEEMDIADLREAVRATTNRDVNRVYENLLRASRNHLRAFASQLAAEGETYDAQYLTQEDFDAIARSPRERGHGARRGSGRGQAGDRQRGEYGQRAQRGARQGNGRGQAGDDRCGECGEQVQRGVRQGAGLGQPGDRQRGKRRQQSQRGARQEAGPGQAGNCPCGECR